MKITSLSTKSIRRTFIQGIGKAALGMPFFATGRVFGELPASENNPQEQTTFQEINHKKLGIALVELGKYSKQKLAPSLKETKWCYLPGIVTGSPHKAEEWKRKYTIPQYNIYRYPEFESIKDNCDLDIVYGVLPDSMNAEFVIRAARAGKHVICEKPMDISMKAWEDRIRVCKENNRLLSIGYRSHFEPHNIAPVANCVLQKKQRKASGEMRMRDVKIMLATAKSGIRIELTLLLKSSRREVNFLLKFNPLKPSLGKTLLLYDC